MKQGLSPCTARLGVGWGGGGGGDSSVGGKSGAILMWVWVFGTTGDSFSPSVNFQSRLSYGVCTAPRVQSHASTSVRTLKIPNTGSQTIVWTHQNTTCTPISKATLISCKGQWGTNEKIYFLCAEKKKRTVHLHTACHPPTPPQSTDTLAPQARPHANSTCKPRNSPWSFFLSRLIMVHWLVL